MAPNSKDLLSYLGKPSKNKSLVDFLSNEGVLLDSELSLGNDEYRAYIERPKDGYSLIFTDESYFLGNSEVPIGAAQLYFSGVFFYSQGKDAYNEYKNSLPFDLSFQDTRTNVINKLGVQSWQRLASDGDRVVSDRWDELPSVLYRLHVTYNKNSGRISIISATIPDHPLS